MSETFVIIGAGHAAGQAAASLRQNGFEGRIVLIGEEPYIPYQRPPLSKKFLSGELEIERLYFKPPEFYEQANIEIRLKARGDVLDAGNKTVTLEDGETIAFDKALITTGARVRKLALPGSDLPGIHYVRSIEDIHALQKDFGPGKHLAVIGGGYIGLEVAAVARQKGLEVTVLEAAPQLLARVAAPELAAFFVRVHREEGVRVRLNVSVTGFTGEAHAAHVLIDAEDPLKVDAVVIGIGVLPNIELAEAAGLHVDNGIVVDEQCRSSHPDIFAAGDCTMHPNSLLGKNLRLESVHNALEQAKTAAANMCGKDVRYAQIPWFWSDQYDLKLQMAGLSQGYDEMVVRGDITTRSFALFYLKQGRLIATDAVNRAPEFMMSKKLIADRAVIAPERLKDESIAMKQILG